MQDAEDVQASFVDQPVHMDCFTLEPDEPTIQPATTIPGDDRQTFYGAGASVEPLPDGTVEGTDEMARNHPFDQTGGIEDNYPDEPVIDGDDAVMSGRDIDDETIAEHEVRISKETNKLSSRVMSDKQTLIPLPMVTGENVGSAQASVHVKEDDGDSERYSQDEEEEELVNEEPRISSHDL